jgi:hypothetical protein
MSRRVFFRLLTVVVIAVVALSALSGVLLAQGQSDVAFARVKAVQEKHTKKLMATKGVVGTAVGHNHEKRLAVKVFIAKAGIAGIPKKLDGVPVHTVVTGPITARKGRPPGKGGGNDDKVEVDRTARFDRPVPIGVSTGHPNVTAGTISCRVTDGINVYALSNNHVYADENQASQGDVVLQPGTYDGGVAPADSIGTLDSYVEIDFSLLGLNTVDAAIALTSTDVLGKATPSDGYGVPKTAIIPAGVNLLNQPVKKYGRTTGLTKGRVYAVNAAINVGYDGGVALFVNQIIITPGSFSAGGDSGSLIVIDGKGKSRANDRKSVGLLFAGSPTITVANPIGDVLNRFGVIVDGE